MIGDPFVVSALINDITFADTLIDTGCLSYGLCDTRFARKHNLPRIPIKPRDITGFDGKASSTVNEVAVVSLDLDGYREERVFMYVTPIGDYNMILGMPWITAQDVRINGPRSEMMIRVTDTIVRSKEAFFSKQKEISRTVQVSATSFMMIKKRKSQKAQVFAVSIADINKALRVKQKTDPATKLPAHFHDLLRAFDPKEAEKLPPHRGSGVDHAIKLEEVDGKKAEAPWGPLYSMSRDELLVLRKTLTELLDKGFIRVSNSPAAAPVLFVKKPGGGLRFCVDYRGLNRITRKDRYPLPLIYETLRNISKARWFTKLDVVAAFHKIRIAEGDEWLTAFRTRYGLYEWMVTPFGLANAPSTFQKYINWALRDYLDKFCSAYIDDILIYSSGSLNQHRQHVRKVLQRMIDAGLQLDIDKCEFEVKSTKYLGFIIEAGKGLRMDPDKIKAISEWESPTSVKGVRSFLGFANFYRTFIKSYSDLVRPLTDLTHKDKKFQWNAEAEETFRKLKEIFVSAPVLAQFDYDKPTRIETDSSGWCIGGTLMQPNDQGLWVPCAFFSKKNNSAECNYEIYDKEMLAIVRCLEEWDSELRGVKDFEIHTDHKNLEYFMTVRKLTERQIRWSLILARYNFKIVHIPGRNNERADALSRRDQDMPVDGSDQRLADRQLQLLKPEMLAESPVITASAATARRKTQGVGEQPDELATWSQAVKDDPEYVRIRDVVKSEARRFPPELKLKVSIAECSISYEGNLLFRGRKWVPKTYNLRTRIIQATHDSMIHGHPGREITYALVARQFFWPGMAKDIRTFIENCDGCGKNKAWRTRRQGFLKPLPIPERIWTELSMDFITELPFSERCTNMIVITDRLSKGVIADGLPNIEAETVARWFVRRYMPHHFLPTAIVSDRGTQFTSALWKRICEILKIKRRLSTSFSPETDGATERANEVVETVLRQYVDWAQDDWMEWLPVAVSAICGRDSASTGTSSFFLSHGWHQGLLDDIDDKLSDNDTRESPIARADRILRKLKEVRDFAQASMASAQEAQERATNRKRDQAPNYKVGDKVWLSLENIKTDRPSKTLDARHAKFTVTEVIGSHNYRLDTPRGIHNVFHSRLLRPANSSPLPGQVVEESHPPAMLVDGTEMYEVERILAQKRARGGGNLQQYLVKWKGYARPTWEPHSSMENTVALIDWKKRVGASQEVVGGRSVRGHDRKRRQRRRGIM
jgi:hypothetical protein